MGAAAWKEAVGGGWPLLPRSRRNTALQRFLAQSWVWGLVAHGLLALLAMHTSSAKGSSMPRQNTTS